MHPPDFVSYFPSLAARWSSALLPAQRRPRGTAGCCREVPRGRGAAASTSALTQWGRGICWGLSPVRLPLTLRTPRGTRQDGCGRPPRGSERFAPLTTPRESRWEKGAPELRPLLRQTCSCHFTSHFTVFVRRREVVTVQAEQRAAS